MPGLVYGVGALGFFAVPYTIFIYPIVFAFMPRFGRICREKGYVTPSDFVEGQFGSRTLGSALALFLYPHTLTRTLSSSSREAIKRNASLLPAYTLLLGLLALMGFMAIAAHVVPPKAYGANGIGPALVAKMFPSWFAGFAFAAIAVGAMVPASIMSIAAAGLQSRER